MQHRYIELFLNSVAGPGGYGYGGGYNTRMVECLLSIEMVGVVRTPYVNYLKLSDVRGV